MENIMGASIDREIKFRAWDKRKKVMIHDNDQRVGELYDLPAGTYIPNTVRRIGEYDKTYMQYTGLKDKNGIDIYESDLIKDTQCRLVGITIVRWVEDSCGFEPFSDSKRCEWCSFGSPTNCVEVIGNIFENPELLAPVK